jgi:hypothetical protein
MTVRLFNPGMEQPTERSMPHSLKDCYLRTYRIGRLQTVNSRNIKRMLFSNMYDLKSCMDVCVGATNPHIILTAARISQPVRIRRV